MKKLSVLLASVCLLTACITAKQTSTTSETSKPAMTPVETVAITYVQSPLNVPSIVEKKKEMFEKTFEKLESKMMYSDLTTGPEQTQALASGDIQFLNAVGATSVILAAANGADIKIMSGYSRSPKGFMLFSKDASIDSAEKLKGKTVAGPKGTILHELLVAYLASANLTQDDINFVSMGLPDAQAALENGSADVALLAGPLAYNAQKSGFHKVTDGEGYTSAFIVTATSQKFYDEHPEYVKAFLDTQMEAVKMINENTDEALKLTQEATNLDEMAVKEMYALYDFSPEITEKDIKALEDTQNFMFDNKMIDQKVDISSLILK